MFCRYLTIIILCCQLPIAFADPCDDALQLVSEATQLPSESVVQQKQLLQRALAKCPNHAEAHNNLGHLLKNEQNYPDAIKHLEQAISPKSTKPNLSEAWHTLGEVYFEQGQLPLSLEAHAHACATDSNSKDKAKELLDNEQYRVVAEGKVFNQESLLVLYDKQRQAKISELLSKCGMRAIMRPVSIFRSLTFFKPGELALELHSQQQLNEIVGALQKIEPTKVSVRSYTTELDDTTANQKLAENRATTVKQVLAKNKVPSQCQNVPCIKTDGFAQLNPPTVKQRIEIEAE